MILLLCDTEQPPARQICAHPYICFLMIDFIPFIMFVAHLILLDLYIVFYLLSPSPLILFEKCYILC